MPLVGFEFLVLVITFLLEKKKEKKNFAQP